MRQTETIMRFTKLPRLLRLQIILELVFAVLLILLLFISIGCTSSTKHLDNPPAEVELHVDLDKRYQEIDGFGASDAWRCQFVGANWPIEKRERIAELLFSKKFDDKGNPKGIGLSIWRFNIGAGTSEQGDSSGIENDWRRAECFLLPDGTYDWSRQMGQQWFLKKADTMGVEKLIAFTNSPPVFYTLNGKGYSSQGVIKYNLKPGYDSLYAKFLSDVILHFKTTHQIKFDYLSPFNEPQWNWDKKGQEGTPALNEDIYRVVKTLSPKLEDTKTDVKILIPEAGQINYLYESVDDNKRGNQLDAFFNPKSEYYLGDIANLEKTVCGHSYHTTWPLKTQKELRKDLGHNLKLKYPSLKYWQSEYCVLEKNDEIQGGHKRDLGMNSALFIARIIHNDLCLSNASSWQWWTALSQVDYKDGLIHLDLGNGNNGEWPQSSPLSNELKYNGNLRETKILWTLGNYSRFIRPGMYRIETNYESSSLNNSDLLQVSAYSDFSEKLVLVIVNHSKDSIRINYNNENLNLKSETPRVYITSETSSLELINSGDKYPLIPARSVATIVYEI